MRFISIQSLFKRCLSSLVSIAMVISFTPIPLAFAKETTMLTIGSAQSQDLDDEDKISPLVTDTITRDFSLPAEDSIVWISFTTQTDCAGAEITITDPTDGEFDAALSYAIYDGPSEESNLISEMGVDLFGSNALSSDNTSTLTVGRAGTYYLAIFNACHINPYYYDPSYVNRHSLNATIKVLTNDPYEDNNSESKATPLYEGKENWFRLLGKDDVDFFKFVAPSKGKVNISVRGENEEFDSSVGYTVYSNENGVYNCIGDHAGYFGINVFYYSVDNDYDVPAAGTYYIEMANAHHWNHIYYSSGVDNKTPLYIKYEFVPDSNSIASYGDVPQGGFESVNMIINGQNSNVLTTVRTIDVLNKDTVFDLQAKLLRNAQKASKFDLYQKNKNGAVKTIATAGSSGVFKNLKYSSFTADYDGIGSNAGGGSRDNADGVYVDALDSNGDVLYSVQTLINVEDSSDADVPRSFEFGDGASLTLSWPFNGNKIDLPICDFPVTAEVGTDGKVKVGVNIDLGDDKISYSKLTDKGFLLDMVSDAKYNNFLLQSGFVHSVGKPKFSAKVAGYVEGSLATGKYKGYLAMNLGFGGSQESQEFVGPVPVVVEISANVSATGSVTVNYHCVNGALKFDDGSINVSGKGEFGIYGGVGLACIASVGVWGKLIPYISYVVTPDSIRGLEELSLEGKAGVKALLLGKSFSLQLTPSNLKTYIYKRDTSLQSVGTQSLSAMADESSSELDRSYLDKTTSWNTDTSDNGANLIQQYVYPDVEPKILENGSGNIAVFLRLRQDVWVDSLHPTPPSFPATAAAGPSTGAL